MLNITNQGNANQNHNEKLLNTSYLSECLSSKKEKKKKANIGEEVEKSEPSYVVGGNVSWRSHCGEQHGGPLEN